MRLFLGLAADQLAGQVSARQSELAPPPGGRLVPAEMWHLTLGFFGDVPPVAAVAIQDAAAEYAQGQPALEISFQRVGAIGHRPPIRVWALCSDSSLAKSAVRRAQQVFRPWLSEREATRPPLVHLTLARGEWSRQPPGRPLRPPISVRTATVVLYQSHLRPEGVHYERLATFLLAD
ncbi:MAG: 2'-5' RNA ligase family protein [Sulfobacillus sp.]